MLNELVRTAELEKVGIADPFRLHRAAPLAEHRAAYHRFQEDKGNTSRQTDQAVRRCERVFEGCGFARLTDLGEQPVLRWLNERRTRGNGSSGVEGLQPSATDL